MLSILGLIDYNGWMNVVVKVTKQLLIAFAIGKYFDEVMCDCSPNAC